MARKSKPIPARIFARMREVLDTFSNIDDCWEWPKSRNAQTGYGQMGYYENGKHFVFTAHRVALAIGNTEPDDRSMCALHKCDNRACINPAHLFWGSQRDNILDMHKKGRARDYIATAARGDRHGSRTAYNLPRGEQNTKSKLTESAVLHMRESKVSATVLAEFYGVTYQTIYAVLKRRTWKHI